MQKLAIVLLGIMVFSAMAVGVASAHERPFVTPTSITVETSFTPEPTDLSLPGYLVFPTLCRNLVGWSAE